MKVALVFLLALIAIAQSARIPRQTNGGAKYTTKYDNINLDSILKNDRLLNNYINCLMDKGNCTPEGSELKRILPEALENGCSKCNDNQKKGAEKVIRFLIEKKQPQFDLLEKKYDPNGVYRRKYKEEANRRNIKV